MGSNPTPAAMKFATQSNYRHNFAAPAPVVESSFLLDTDGNPVGGHTVGPGFDIDWQNGVVTSPDAINGANVIDILEVVRQRLEFFNTTKFKCRENSIAITKIEEAIHWLDARIQDRKVRNVLSTMEP